MTRRAAIRFTLAAAVAATGLSAFAGRGAVALIETHAMNSVRSALVAADDWMDIDVSGTVLRLSGTAPDGAAQIAALSRIGKASAGLTVIDRTTAEDLGPADAPDDPAGPPPQLEILRDGQTITMFGQVPAADLEAGRFTDMQGFGDETEIAPLLTSAGTANPQGWDSSVELAFESIPLLEKLRIVVDPGHVTVSGVADSEQIRDRVVARLQSARTQGVGLTIDISAPRPVIAPFTFRAEWPAGGALEISQCAAETETGRALIIAAAEALDATADCRIGLGAPSPDWGRVVASGIGLLGRMGGGTLDVSDSEIALRGPRELDPATFLTHVEWLDRRLPEIFSLTASLPPPDSVLVDAGTPPALFTATRARDGAAHIGGDLTDMALRQTLETFAEAQFGFDRVVNSTGTRGDLPSGWGLRVLAGLEALAQLTEGRLNVSETTLALSGTASGPGVEADIRQMLTARLPEDIDLDLTIRVRKPPEVADVMAVPAELCAEQIALILDDNQIVFPPSQTAISGDSVPVIDRIAEILMRCPGARFEIGGHTDSQGREESNMTLSRARADAVLRALLDRQVDTVFLYAKGYGETQPIASNEDEEGRSLNRRIEFRLLPAEHATDLPAGDGPSDSSGNSVAAPADDAPPSLSRAAGGPTDAIVPGPPAEVEERAPRDDPEAVAIPSEAEPATEEDAPAADETGEDAPQRPLPRPDTLDPAGD